MSTDRDQVGAVPRSGPVPQGGDDLPGSVDPGVGTDPLQTAEPTRRRRAVEAEKKKRTPLGMVIEVVIIVAAAFAIAMLVQAFIVKPFTIHQVSMQPTLQEGDRILLNRLSYHFRDPERGDVVVFHSPMIEGEDLVKRVIGLPGDVVAVKEGSLYVNGVSQEEPYVLEREILDEDQEVLVPADHVFVMGDNRNNSGDSRFFGPIEIDSIIGCAFCIYWPIGHWRGL
ncbi:MAG: signal peptidase I [Thermoleophilia bacterium]|nr:signal peptidase I [Thermoleophilia bacterium]